jgi:DNA-binding MarR family transcriptional regulator
VLVADAALASSLRISVMRLARRLRLERSGDDRTLNQLAVLGTLDRRGPLTVGELAATEKVKPPSMTRTVACLEEAGLATRRAHDTDRRQVVVELTDAARDVLADDRRRRDAWLAQRLGALDADELELLHRVAPLLERLAAT